MKRLLYAILTVLPGFLWAGRIEPGFDSQEFRKLFQVTAHQADTPWTKSRIPLGANYKLVYRSPVTGLDNRWDLWHGPDSTTIISIRGTTGTSESWLENFYAGMIPAKGTLNMGNGNLVPYQLASDSTACVHIGWTIGLLSMAPDIRQKINEEYSKGFKDVLIIGHSQGGAIALLLYSYLHYEKGKGIPEDLRVKVYASAAPKPGNLAYSYDFDFISRGGWAFRIVNSLDWVPEVPFTIQTLNDINSGNPFSEFDTRFKGAGFPVRVIAKAAIRRMNRPALKAQKRFRKYLAVKTGKFVRKKIPGMPKHEYIRSMCYVSCGVPIILRPDTNYHQLYADNGKSIFTHHGFGPYYYLLNIHYPIAPKN